jgi:hypothetical protein
VGGAGRFTARNGFRRGQGAAAEQKAVWEASWRWMLGRDALGPAPPLGAREAAALHDALLHR